MNQPLTFHPQLSDLSMASEFYDSLEKRIGDITNDLEKGEALLLQTHWGNDCILVKCLGFFNPHLLVWFYIAKIMQAMIYNTCLTSSIVKVAKKKMPSSIGFLGNLSEIE